jgi:hypothetical protein
MLQAAKSEAQLAKIVCWVNKYTWRNLEREKDREGPFSTIPGSDAANAI